MRLFLLIIRFFHFQYFAVGRKVFGRLHQTYIYLSRLEELLFSPIFFPAKTVASLAARTKLSFGSDLCLFSTLCAGNASSSSDVLPFPTPFVSVHDKMLVV